MFGFGPIGVNPIGTGPRGGHTITVLQVAAASYAITASATVAFSISDNISPAAFVVAGQGVTEKEIEAVGSTSFAVTGQSATFSEMWSIAPGSVAVTANPVLGFDGEAIQPAPFTVSVSDVEMSWTGAGVDPLQYGGIGHYKLEAERVKQLAAIERKPPPPIDLRSQPRFAPISAAPVAPPAPQVDLAAITQQRMGAQMQAAQAAKKRRNEQALLLLAS
jgi:hypothetical protein